MNTGIYWGVNVFRLTVCTTLTLLVACFCMSQVGQAQEQGRQERPVKSGPAAGATIPGPFNPVVVLHADSPEHAGKRWDFVEQYGAAPFVLIFARTTSVPLTDFLTKLDTELATSRNLQGKKAADGLRTLPVHAALILLSDEDELDGRLKKLAKKLKIKHVSIAIDNPTGPRAYDLDKQADVTVLLVKRRKVEANFAFRKGELRQMNVEQVIRDLQRILKPADETSEAFDLRQVERVVAKEPVYQSKPKYCLVVFGQQAKTRV